MSQPVPRNQRWSRTSPCPICGGTPPHCNGYAGEKDGVIFCTDSSLSGGLLRGEQGQYRHWLKAPCDCGVTHGFAATINFPEKKKSMSEPVTKRLEATFDYGDGCFVDRIWTSVIATSGKNKKEYLQYRVLSDGEKSYTGFKKIYPAPDKRRWGNSLLYTEGEKQVDALKDLGFEAFCFPGGSGGWTNDAADIYCEELKGKFIFIWPDNDEAGAKLAERMSNSFKARGIKHVIVNTLTAGLPTTGDVIDWLKIPGNDSDKLEKILAAHSPAKRFFTISEYGLIPPVEWLFEPLFIERGLSLTVGESEVGKSFITLFYACQIAKLTGRPVIYLGLESFSQYPERVLALIKHYQWELGDKFILSNYPLQLLDKASVEGFIQEVKERGLEPAMVVVDTYHAATEGADEISGQDTGIILSGLKMIRDLLATNVNCIHHLNAAGSRERGHTSLKAAMDTMIVLKTDGDGVALECGKQRTARHFDTRTINWAYLEDGSRVAVESGQAAKVDFTRLGKNDDKLLRVLGAELHRAKGLRYAQILALTGMPQSSLINALKKCRTAGWVQGGDDTPNIITNEGLEMVGYQAGEISEY